MSNSNLALSIMAHDDYREKFTTVGCSFMKMISTLRPISLPDRFSDVHPFYEFMVLFSDLPEFQIDGHRVSCQAQTILPINPGQQHGVIKGSSRVSYTLILFEREAMDRLIRQVSGSPFSQGFPNMPQPLRVDIRHVLMRLLQEKDGLPIGREIIVPRLAEELAVLLVRHYYQPLVETGPGNPDLLSGEQLRFQPAIRLMHNEFAKRLTIEQMAELNQMNSFNFIRAFKKAFNTSPYSYLTRLRIACAKQKLAKSNMPAAKIGKSCGFQSASRFSAVFFKVTGMTPSQYRKASQPDS
ncbi:MAG TPA: hypothetical protein DCM45_01460 [Clostridiales bacterium]|nr:hypothetical protein [Clostridiales bacterium]